jgi:hypothetical protein
MMEFGMKDAKLEPWGQFGRGWTLKRFSAQVVEPDCIPLIAFPKAWSPGIEGVLEAEVVHFDPKTEADFAKYKSKLKGKVVLTGVERPLTAHFEADATRRTDKQLLDLADADPAAGRSGRAPRPFDAAKKAEPAKKAESEKKSEAVKKEADDLEARMAEFRSRMAVSRRRLSFLVEEGAAAMLEPSFRGDFGTIFVMGASVPTQAQAFGEGAATAPSAWSKDAPKTIPQIVLSIEHHNRLLRMLEANKALKLSLELKVEFQDEDLMGYNTVAEIPGTDPKLKDEIVMLGGHMDS